MNKTIAQMVTDRIIEEMSKGEIPWNKPWIGGSNCAISHNNGKPYSLIKQILLGKAGEWLTFKQCEAEGGKVRKGEKAHFVIFWKMYIKKEEIDGEKVEKTIPTLKYYQVFHIDQCDGIEPKYGEHIRYTTQPEEAAEAIVREYESREHITINREEESGRAYYRPSTDSITIPNITQFAEVSEYYSTLFHEMVHSTGHSSRLNRLGEKKIAAFGDEDYSKEELIAELGAAMLNNHVGIETPETFRNSAAYLQGWLKALKDDATLIISAASKAEKAYYYILEGAKANA